MYGQEPEVRLLAAFLPKLANRVVIDAGAERGSFAQTLLDAGAEEAHVIEPDPANVATLRARFSGDSRVRIHAHAVSAEDGRLLLYRSTTPDGESIPFGHTVLERPDTDEIAWGDSISVDARSLASLITLKEIPARAAILKVDTEGHDLAVVRGMGQLEADVVMVEHWDELPGSLGPCPWTAEEMCAELRGRGFSHFALLRHHGEFTTLRWDDATVGPGEMGNLVFVHDRVLDLVIGDLLACASALAAEAASFAVTRGAAAAERLAAVEELRVAQDQLQRTADARLELIEQLRRELDVQVKAAADRQAALDALAEEHQRLGAVAAERLAALEQLTEELERVRLDRDEQARAAAERLQVIGELRQAEALEQLAEELELVRRDRDEQARAAAERLALIDELDQERARQAAVAAERLKALEELKAEADVRQHALDELSAQRHFG